MGARQKPIILIGAILLVLASVSSIDNLTSMPNSLNWLTSPDNNFVPATALDILSMLVITIGSAGLAIWALVAKTPKVLGIPAIAFIVAGPVIAIGLNLYFVSLGDSFIDAFFQTWGGPWRIAASGSVFTSLIGAGLVAAAAFRSKPGVANSQASAPVAGGSFDPMTGERIAPAPAYVDPTADGVESNLPLAALILAFFVPLAAVIVGHISLSQMKQGLISSRNLGMAKAGLILGYVFIGLGFLLGIILSVVYVLAMSRGY